MSAVPLEGLRTLAVLSPHLDDAVLSLGGLLRHASRAGCEVRVVTVLANDPGADRAAGPWDAACGFDSVGAAARARREEDRRASAVVGVRSDWLPYGDEQYDRGGSDDEIWREIKRAVSGADVVLVPGYPLHHADHRWLATLVIDRRHELESALWLYGEEPYAAGELFRAGKVLPPDDTAAVQLGVSWRRVGMAVQDRLAKLHAIARYKSQLRKLGLAKLAAVQLQELRRRGELVAWP